jgi:ribosomal protein S18 acetylase RimI-like enzyme
LRLAAEGAESILVAELDGAIRGVLSVRWRGGCDGDRPWFYGAEVHRAWRNLGIGTALWAAGEDLARSRGCAEAALDVEVINTAARRLYERLGYYVVRPHVHTWRSVDPGTGEVIAHGQADTWAMRKLLLAASKEGLRQ